MTPKGHFEINRPLGSTYISVNCSSKYSSYDCSNNNNKNHYRVVMSFKKVVATLRFSAICIEYWGPFKYYVSKEVGGWGPK